MEYKLLKDEADHYIVHHPAGHVMRVAKQSLPPELHERIRHMASGGKVESQEQDPQYALAKGQSDIAKALGNPNPPPPEGMKRLPSGNYLDQSSHSIPKERVGYAEGGEIGDAEVEEPSLQEEAANRLSSVGPQIEAVPPVPPTPAPMASSPIAAAQPQAPEPFEEALKEYQQSFEQQKAAQTQIGQAEAQKAQTEADIYGKLAKQFEPLNFQKSQEQSAKDSAALDQQSKELQQDIMSNKLDYNRLWANRGYGDQVLSLAGLVLGGIGAGMTGRGSDALAVMNNAIDRDIKQQQDELGKKNSLLKFNLEKTNDIRQAEILTRHQMMDAVLAKVNQAASTSQSPVAQSQAQIANAAVMQEQAKLKQQLALYKLQYQMGTQPFHKEMLGYATPDQAKRAIILPDGQHAVLATDEKAAEDARKTVSSTGPLLNTLDRIEQLGAQPLGFSQHAEELRSLIPSAVIQMKQAQGAGIRGMTPEIIDLMQSQLGDPRKFIDLLRGDTRLKTFRDTLRQSQDAALTSASPAYKSQFNIKGLKKAE